MSNTQETEEMLKRTDEQLKALKRQVSGVPDSLHTEAPVKPETEVKPEAETKQPETEPSKSATHKVHRG